MTALSHDGDGVTGAVNGWTVTDDGHTAFLWDPTSSCIISIDLDTSQRKTFEWLDAKEFEKHNWLCYCLFHVAENLVEEQLLICLLYNIHQKSYYFLVFSVSSSDVLVEMKRFRIKIPNIQTNKLAYTAHKTQDDRIQVIFYEWLDSNRAEKPGSLSANLSCRISLSRSKASVIQQQQRAHFVICTLECTAVRIKMHKEQCGVLPPKGRWQLPFVSSDKIHFLKLDKQAIHLASLKLNTETHATELSSFVTGSINNSNGWQIKSTANTLLPSDGDDSDAKMSKGENQMPSTKAIWCNAWKTPSLTSDNSNEDACYFVVVSKKKTKDPVEAAPQSYKSVNEPKADYLLKLNLWHLDVQSASWSKIDSHLDLPPTSSRFSIRIGKLIATTNFLNTKSSQNKYEDVQLRNCNIQTTNADIFLHYDLNGQSAALQQINAIVHKKVGKTFDNEQYVNLQKLEPENKPVVNLSDVICSVCLETYVDPRTLFCGHSLCFSCLVKMRESIDGNYTKKACSSVKCPSCRKLTKIPKDGLPTNYGLQEAIEILSKQQSDLFNVAQQEKESIKSTPAGSEMKDDEKYQAEKSEFQSKLDYFLLQWRKDLVHDIDSSLVESLREFYAARFVSELTEMHGFYENSCEPAQQTIKRIMSELECTSQVIKAKTRTLIEAFSRRLPLMIETSPNNLNHNFNQQSTEIYQSSDNVERYKNFTRQSEI